MRKNRLIALIGTLTMAAAGLAAVSAGVSSKKAESVSAWTSDSVYLAGSFNSWSTTADKLDVVNSNEAEVTKFFDYDTGEKTFKLVVNDKWLSMNNMGWGKDNTGEVSKIYEGNGDMKLWTNVGSSGSRVAATFHFWCSYGDAQAMKVDLVQAYKVTFNSNGGSAVSSIEDKSGSSIAKPTDPTKSGATFGGWYTDSGLSTPASWPLTLNSNKTLYAKWLADSYTVAFNNNGGSGAMTSIVTEVGNTTAVPSCTFTAPAGYKFKEWNSQADGMGDTYDSTHPVPSQAKDTTKTIYAIWQEFNPHNGYWIEFEGTRDPQRIALAHNGGTTAQDSEWTALGVSLNAGDKFKVVNYSAESKIGQYGTEHAYSGGAVTYGQIGSDNGYYKVNTNAGGTYDFYFHDLYDEYKVWIPAISYQVTYHPTEGTGSDYVIHPEVTNNYRTAEFNATGFTAPTGKTLKGWNTAADGSGTFYAPNTEVTGSNAYAQNSTHDLYAVWRDKVANGTYLRGGSWGWDEENQKTMSPNPDNNHEQMLKGVALNKGEGIKVITYTDDVGTYHSAQSTNMAGDGYALSIDSNGNAVLDSSSTNARGVFNVYVNTYNEDAEPWKYSFYALRVSYNSNGGSGSMSSSYPTGEGYFATVAENGFTAPTANESFAGWNTQADGKGTSYAAGATIDFSSATDNVTLYAQWEDSTVYRTITFSTVEDEEDRGTIDATSVIVPDGTTFNVVDNQIEFDDDKNTVVTATASDPDERYSYSFYEWTYYSGKLPDDGTIESDFTIYAKFDAQDVLYTITLDYDDGKGGSSSINNLKLDDELTVVSVPRYVGHTFNGYFTGKNGTGTKYYDEEGLPVHQYFDDSTVTTLYASWTHDLYTVDFALPADHPGTAPESIDLYYGDSYSLSAPEAWAGHDFDAWYTGPNGTGNKVSNTGTYPFEDDLTLYANFTLNDYAISFEKDGGTGGSLSLTSYNISNIAQTFTITDPELSENHPSYSIEVSDTFVGDKPTIDDHTVTIPAGSYGDFTVVTTWIPNDPQVTITIVGGSYGSVTVNDELYEGPFTVPYDSEYIIEENSIIIGEDFDFEIVAEAGDGSPEFEYTFEGWDGLDESGNITENTVITATFSSKTAQYTLSYGGSDYTKPTSPAEGSHDYGTVIQTSPEATKANHHLEGWYTDSGLTQKVTFPYTISGDVTLYPNFILDDETITITINGNYGVVKNGSGNVVSSIDVPYGSLVEIKSNGEIYIVGEDDFEASLIPVANDGGAQHTNSFTGWTGIADGDQITTDKNITASFSQETRKYTITFVNYDDSELQSSEVAYGSMPSYTGNTPTKPNDDTYSYTFAGWDKTIVSVEGEATYKATFTPTILPEVEARLFASKFLEEMGKVCDEDGKTEESDLAGAWKTLFESTDWTELSPEAKNILKTAKPDSESSDLTEKFGASYDYICSKYKLDNNVDRDLTKSPYAVTSNNRLLSVNDISTSTWIIASVAIVGIAAAGVFFIYRKRKEN